MKVIAVVLAILSAVSVASAEQSLSLEDVLARARAQNFDIAAAKARLSQAKVGIEQAWVALLPQVGAQGKYTHNYKEVDFDLSKLTASLPPGLGLSLPSLSNITIQKEEQLDSSLNVTVPLVVPSAYASVAAAKHDFAAGQANFRVTETNVLYTTAQAFYAAAGADELMKARQDAVAVAKQTLANSQAALNAGTAKRADVNQAQVSLLRAEQALREAQDTRDQAFRALATLVQLPESFSIAVKNPAQVSYSVEELERDALERRPEFRAYDAQLASVHAQVSANHWKWSPTLSGFGQAKLSNYKSFSGDYYSWALGAELDWQIYDGGGRDAQAHLAEAQLAETEQKLNALRATVRDDIENALAAVKTKRQAVDTSEQAAKLAKETLALVRVQYDAGTSKQLDVLEAQDSLISAEVMLAQSRFDVALSLLALAHSAGHFPEGVLQ